DHLPHLAVVDEALERRTRIGAGNQQVEISDGFLAAPQAAGWSDFLDAGSFFQVGAELGSKAVGVIEQKASGTAAVLLDGSQDLLLELLAHARQQPEFSLFADPLEVIDRAHPIVLVDQRDSLGTEALDLEQLERGRRILREQQIAPLEAAAFGDLLQHGGDTFADAADLGYVA